MHEQIAGWRRLTTTRYRATVVLWAIYSLGLVAGSLLPGHSVPKFSMLGWDKLAHAVAFAGLAALSIPVVFDRRRWPWIVITYGTLMGVVTEAVQRSTPGRFFSHWDVLADIVGTAVYLAIAAIILRGHYQESGADPSAPGEVISPNLDS
jgi:VanZ family protein